MWNILDKKRTIAKPTQKIIDEVYLKCMTYITECFVFYFQFIWAMREKLFIYLVFSIFSYLLGIIIWNIFKKNQLTIKVCKSYDKSADRSEDFEKTSLFQ